MDSGISEVAISGQPYLGSFVKSSLHMKAVRKIFSLLPAELVMVERFRLECCLRFGVE